MLIFHVLSERGVCYLVLHDLGIFQVQLDRLSGKTGKFTSFLFVPLFDLIFSLLGSLLQSSGLRCNSLSMLLR